MQGWEWKIIPRLIQRLKRKLSARIAYSEFFQKMGIVCKRKFPTPVNVLVSSF